jgi:thioester reductase-like protein/1-acyl-sn-glycerol-3-phosphate acyltransferase
LARDRDAGDEILLTGATGFLGKVVLHELLRRREELGVARVHLLVRGRRGRSAEQRFRSGVHGSECFSRLPGSWPEHVRVVEGELTQPGAGLAPDARRELTRRIDRVIHCAASIEFQLPLAEAAAANVTSALNVLELVQECAQPCPLVHVSTAYVTPHPGDDVPVPERLARLPRPATSIYAAILAGDYAHPEAEAELLAETGHPNTYTLTKSVTEHLLAERTGRPLTLVRPSIVSASLHQPFPGWIDSPAAFAALVMMVASGRMRAVIGRARTRVDLVPVDVVASRIVAAAFDPPVDDVPRIRHLVAGPARSPSVGLCAERITKFFRRNPLAGGRGPVAAVRYLGPDGLLYRLGHWLHHQRRRESRPIAGRLADTNRAFAYFTRKSFRFESSVPFDEPDFVTRDYVDLICRGTYRHLLDGDKTEVPLAGRGHRRARGDLWWALLQPRGNPFIRLAAYLVAKALRRATDRVTVDVESFREARAAAAPNATQVIAPSHRSYLDFVLVSFFCFARPDLGIAIPHVAAAIEFARIPVLGWLFRRLHAFYLERGRGREEKALTLRVHELVHGGDSIEFFVEGRRSRSRRFLPPRRGLLRSLQATGRPCALLPVAISYDHVPEEATFLEELRGAPTPPMRLRDLIGWTVRLLRGDVTLGRIHIACGRPLPLDLSTDVQALADDLVGELQRETIATSHQLRAFLARTNAEVELTWLRRALARRGGRVLEVATLECDVPGEIERCMRDQFIHHFYPEASLHYAGNPAIEHHVRRNRWAPGALHDPEAELEDPRVRSVVHALFDPVRRDYARAARTLEEALAQGQDRLPSPAELTRRFADAHLPDLAAAFEDMTERGLLTRRDADAAWQPGPYAAEVASYRQACEGESPA